MDYFETYLEGKDCTYEGETRQSAVQNECAVKAFG